MLLALSLAIAAGALAWGFVLRLRAQRLAATLDQSQRRLRALVRELPAGVVVHGRRTEILECNPAAADLFGLPEAKLLGRTCSDAEWNIVLADGSSLPGAAHPVSQALATRKPVRSVIVGVTRSASWERAWLLMSAEPQLAADGSVERVVCTFVDVTARRKLEEQISDQALRDPLTGCFSRRYLAEFEARVEGGRSAGSRWGCVVVDVAGFKQYNETHGHQAGDDVLVRMSRFLMLQVRAGEAVLRIGGDEFLALLTSVDEVTIEAVVQRMLKEAMRQAPISFSMGWAARVAGEPLEKTLARAEQKQVTVSVAERPAEQRRSAAEAGAARASILGGAQPAEDDP